MVINKTDYGKEFFFSFYNLWFLLLHQSGRNVRHNSFFIIMWFNLSYFYWLCINLKPFETDHNFLPIEFTNTEHKNLFTSRSAFTEVSCKSEFSTWCQYLDTSWATAFKQLKVYFKFFQYRVNLVLKLFKYFVCLEQGNCSDFAIFCE